MWVVGRKEGVVVLCYSACSVALLYSFRTKTFVNRVAKVLPLAGVAEKNELFAN